MKLKCIPEDFQVDEVIDLANAPGPFCVYRLTKWSTGTLEAVDEILHRWNLPREVVAFAGLKDKHARTTQYLTIRNGPQNDLRTEKLQLEFLGRTPREVGPTNIEANQFTIVMRNMSAEEVQRAEHAAKEIATFGVPNYFDDQRFGSLGESGEFIAHPWCQGNWERTMWLLLADPNFHDRPDEKEQKRLLRENWKDWLKCKEILARSHRRSIITYLCDKPEDFRGALARVRHDLRSLYLSAYQSDLWNGLLDRMLRARCQPEQLTSLKVGRREVAFFRELSEEQRPTLHAAKLPLPSARLHEVDPEVQTWIDEILVPEQIELREIRVKYPRDSFFSRGERKAVIQPRDLEVLPAVDDDLYPGRQKMTCRFVLPRGSYATMLVKRLTSVAAGADLSAEIADDPQEAGE